MAAQGLASHMAFAGLMGEDLAMFAPEGDDGAQLDGIPSGLSGPCLPSWCVTKWVTPWACVTTSKHPVSTPTSR